MTSLFLRTRTLYPPIRSTPYIRFSAAAVIVRSMSTAKHYDAVIVGSGQSGTPLAGAFARAGKSVALVESTHIGGCCVNEGCSPTKTMVASGRVAYLTRRGADYGVHSGGSVSVDMKKVRERKQGIVDSFRDGNEKRTKDAGVDIIMGEGRFKDAKTMVVKEKEGEREITAGKYYLNVGERPAVLKMDGLEGVPKEKVLNSTSIQELTEVPKHLIVLGGGYIGLEFGQLFRRLGSDVTIIQRGKQLLPREDPDIAESMLKILQEDGITVHLSTSAVSASADGDTVNVNITGGSSASTVSGSHILAAAGRVPNTDTLNLSAAGVSVDKRGYIQATPLLETTAENIFVMGDCKGPPAFTHISYDDYRIIKQNHLDQSATIGTLSTTNRVVPYVVYTDPQLGHVGLHEAEAREKFPDREIKVAKMPMTWVARALETDETRGMMKATVDAQTGEILGFTCLGLEGGEIMSIVQTAMMGGLKYEKLQNGVWAHPTLAESLNNLWGNLE